MKFLKKFIIAVSVSGVLAASAMAVETQKGSDKPPPPKPPSEVRQAPKDPPPPRDRGNDSGNKGNNDSGKRGGRP